MPILSRSAVAPLPVENNWTGLSLTWTDYRGRSWDLLSGEDGVVLAQGGCRGLGMPSFDRFSAVSPALAGSRWRGHRATEREVWWPLFVWSSTSSEDFLARERDWWAGIRPDVQGTWTVATPDGRSRSLALRFVDDGDPAPEVDPVQSGWAVYGVTLVAEQPFWSGPPIERTWRVVQDLDWLAPPAGVLQITAGASVDTAVADNPGDVEAWPVWTITGAVDGASCGIGGGVVEYQASIAAGASVTIDTRPDRLAATTSTGVDVSPNVVWTPAPVPPGAAQEAQVVLSSPGSGASATLTLQPQYYRAW